ncbi:hypothetical protein [Streptomyces sp. MST-110588]|uniref:hypothetical protein n=1 Tax=Streptomyces sp. MST-110588 TaxID=2833628 RepID=UPI001F5D32D1|nr:hypothetical protein [Streptomyces sp. MST-110588]UNO39497.1 hypothetical protein KGS77_07645 [Streptomyces sp. MST-110588]
MTQEVRAEEAAVPQQQGAPKGLLQQMDELMAALNADLSDLSIGLRSPASYPAGDDTTSSSSPRTDLSDAP